MTSLLLGLLTFVAYATATLSGVLGMGGGIVLVGVLAAALPATAVVPVHGVVQLASNSARTVVFLRHVRWSIFFAFAPFLLLGVGGAILLYRGSDLPGFKPLIGVFILCFLVWRQIKPTLRTPPLWVYAPLGVVAGFLTMFVGATGPFIAPFFLRDDLEKEQVIATKAVCQSVGHALKIPAFLSLGFDYVGEATLLGWMIAAVVLGTLTGKKLLTRLDPKWFERLFLALLTLLALHLIGSWIWIQLADGAPH
jgi:uncharacterized membrane protein YfcA